MLIEKIRLGNKEVMPFTIPSGIVTTQPSSLERVAKMVPEIGILTTKTILPERTEGYREPILTQYGPGCWMNAIGLRNPGAEEFARQLAGIDFPSDKFLLCSIAGRNPKEFVYVAKTVKKHVDGLDLNGSCPHVKGHGVQVGRDLNMVRKVVRGVRAVTDIPIFFKVGFNMDYVAVAKAAMEEGATGITAINTVGPGYHTVNGNPVLKNGIGGMSGRGIRPIGLRCVREIRQAVGEGVPINVMGGISLAEHVREYAAAAAGGPVVFGIGSALAGMTDNNIQEYLPILIEDINKGTDFVSQDELIKDVDTTPVPVRVDKVVRHADDLVTIVTNHNMEADAGQFVFAWMPGVGEKPFSVIDDNPLTLTVQARGEFTNKFTQQEEGDKFYIRGPYGEMAYAPSGSDIVLVGGGCGIAGIALLAQRWQGDNLKILLGAKDKAHIPYLDLFKSRGEVYVATIDGSLGTTGTVLDLFMIGGINLEKGSYFFNCGPKAMIDTVVPIEETVSDRKNIYSSLDEITSCGVGLCGGCADYKGRRTCVEGPFMSHD